MTHFLHTKKRPITKRTVIAIILAVFIIGFLASCGSSKDGCGAPSIGNDKTSTVLKHYR